MKSAFGSQFRTNRRDEPRAIDRLLRTIQRLRSVDLAGTPRIGSNRERKKKREIVALRYAFHDFTAIFEYQNRPRDDANCTRSRNGDYNHRPVRGQEDPQNLREA